MPTVHPGHTLKTHGTLAASRTLSVDAGAGLTVDTGAVNNGTINLYGAAGSGAAAAGLVAYGATVTNATPGTIFVQGGTGAGLGATLTIGGTLNNAGNLYAVQPSAGGAPTISIADAGALYNTGVIKLTAAAPGGGLPYTAGPTLYANGVLTNSGALILGGGSTTPGGGASGAYLYIRAYDMINTGTMVLYDGTGTVAPASGTRAGAEARLFYGALINQGQITIGALAPGEGPSTAGAELYFYGYSGLVNYGTITVARSQASIGAHGGGTLQISGPGYSFNYGVIDVQGANGPQGAAGVLSAGNYYFLTSNGGSIVIGAGYNGGAGATAIFDTYLGFIGGRTAPATLTIAGSTDTTVVTPGTAIVNGHLTIGPGSEAYLQGPDAPHYPGAGGLLTVTSEFSLYGGRVAGHGTLVNTGRIETNSVSTLYTGLLVNNGLIEAFGGSLDIDYGDVSGKGTLAIDYGARLGIYAQLESGQTVQFSSNANYTETLATEFVSYLGGTLSGLNSTSTIYAAREDVTGVSTNGKTLTIDTSFGTYHLSLAAPLPANTSFTLTPGSGGHGTYIGFNVPGALSPPTPNPHSSANPAAHFSGHLTT